MPAKADAKINKVNNARDFSLFLRLVRVFPNGSRAKPNSSPDTCLLDWSAVVPDHPFSSAECETQAVNDTPDNSIGVRSKAPNRRPSEEELMEIRALYERADALVEAAEMSAADQDIDQDDLSKKKPEAQQDDSDDCPFARSAQTVKNASNSQQSDPR